jgi:hypothetical protein
VLPRGIEDSCRLTRGEQLVIFRGEDGVDSLDSHVWEHTF